MAVRSALLQWTLLISVVWMESFALKNPVPFTVTKFVRDVKLDDYYCENEVIRVDHAASLVECVQICRSGDDAGVGVLYKENDGMCQCHREKNSTVLGCKLEMDSGHRMYTLVGEPMHYPVDNAETRTAAVVDVPIMPTGIGIIDIALASATTDGMVGIGLVALTSTPAGILAQPVTSPISTVVIGHDEWEFRLVNGSWKSGRLEIAQNGIWGVVYGFSFSVSDATILCRDIFKLGIYGFPIYGNYFGDPGITAGLSKDYITEYDTMCFSNLTCDMNMWSNSISQEFHAFGTVGLDCTDDDLGVRLADGDDPSSGRLEVNLLGQWGTVCGDSLWDDGPMFCRHFGLNYTSFELAGTNQTSGPVWIHGGLYACDDGNTTSSSPADCDWSPYTISHFITHCNHTADVILHCN